MSTLEKQSYRLTRLGLAVFLAGASVLAFVQMILPNFSGGEALRIPLAGIGVTSVVASSWIIGIAAVLRHRQYQRQAAMREVVFFSSLGSAYHRESAERPRVANG